MDCPKCGTKNTKESKFCVKCGNDMTKTKSKKSQTVADVNLNNKKTNNKKIFIIIAAVIVVAIVAFILIKKLGGDLPKNVSSIFNPDQPILVEKDDKYGYINSDGKFIIDPVYESASSFNGDFAVVKSIVTKEGVELTLYQVIDKKGNVNATSEYASNIKYISDGDVWIINDQLYNGSLKKISKDGIKVSYEDGNYLKWVNSSKKTGGIMTLSGKVTYTYEFADGESYIGIDPSENDVTLTENYCRITIENEKYGIVNCDTGKVVYNYTDKYISVEDDNIFEVKEKDTYSFISIMYIQNDKLAYQSSSSEVDLKYYSGYVQIRDAEKDYSERYSYYDIKSGKVVNEKPSSSSQSSDISEWENLTGLKKFSCDTGKGLMEGEKVLLSCEYDDVNFFGILLYQYLESDKKEYVMAEKDDKTFIINLKNGKTVAEFNSSSVYDSNYSTFVYYKDESTNKKVVYNLITGKTYTTDNDNNINLYSNYVTIKENNKLNYYNIDLKLIYTEEN